MPSRILPNCYHYSHLIELLAKKTVVDYRTEFNLHLQFLTKHWAIGWQSQQRIKSNYFLFYNYLRLGGIILQSARKKVNSS